MANFHFSYAPGTPLEQMVGFEVAGQIWSHYLRDDITVEIYVQGTEDLPENVIGATLPGTRTKQRYTDVYEELVDDATSATDHGAIAHLSEEREFAIAVNGNQNLDKTKEIQITNANAKALGLIKGGNDKLDGYILVNSSETPTDHYQWSYDTQRGTPNAGNQLDFLSVAIHEVGHVLGFTSGLDDPGWLAMLSEAQERNKDIKADGMKYSTPLDFFRYSDASALVGQPDLSIGQQSYFSVDGGQTALAEFATGKSTEFGGDGHQASHWKQRDALLGIMDPVLLAGQQRTVSALDILAMDAIGWDVNATTPPSDVGSSLNLATLTDLANQQLGQRLGVSVQDLWRDADRSADAISADRLKDVEKMLNDSNNYEWGCRRPGSTGSRWQEILDLFAQQGQFQVVSAPVNPSTPPRKAVPSVAPSVSEPRSISSNVGGSDDFAWLGSSSVRTPTNMDRESLSAESPAIPMESQMGQSASDSTLLPASLLPVDGPILGADPLLLTGTALLGSWIK
jgi:hypothetical protein